MEAAEQLVQLSEEDTMSCSSGTGGSVGDCEGKGGGNTKRQDDVVSSKVEDMVGKEQNGGVCSNKNVVTDGRSFMKAIMETSTRIHKKKKFRSLASIYRATQETTRD